MCLRLGPYLPGSKGFPGSSEVKESDCNADPGSIPGSRRSPGQGNGNPLQYCCLENSMDREVWQAAVHGFVELDMTEQLLLTSCVSRTFHSSVQFDTFTTLHPSCFVFRIEENKTFPV